MSKAINARDPYEVQGKSLLRSREYKEAIQGMFYDGMDFKAISDEMNRSYDFGQDLDSFHTTSRSIAEAVKAMRLPRVRAASDRKSLIRLASTMPVGSPERKAILAGLEKTSSRMGVDVLTSFVDPKKFMSTLRTLDTDEQSQDLLQQVRRKLMERLTPDSSTERALNRLSNLVSGNQDPANLRNQIFKVANELGIRLPSGMF